MKSKVMEEKMKIKYKRLTLILTVFLFLIFCFNTSYACTAFIIDDAEDYCLVRNLDIPDSYGYIMINKTNVTKTAFIPDDMSETPAVWTSKYGSVTFNQISRDIPQGGMNTAGLVIEHLQLNNTQYEHVDSRQVVTTHNYNQYVLDNCATVAEVIDAFNTIRLTGFCVKAHYIIVDASGDYAIIEVLNGQLRIRSKADMGSYYKAISNSDFISSINEANKYQIFGGTIPTLPAGPFYVGTGQSLSRFVLAADAVRRNELYNPSDPINYGFTELENITTGSGVRFVWDLNNRCFYYKTVYNTSIRQINIDDYDYSPGSDNMVIHADAAIEPGNWVEYSTALNTEMFDQLLARVPALVTVYGFDDYKSQIVVYPESAIYPTDPTPTPEPSHCGDVNFDGNISILDALLIAQFYVDLDPHPFYQSAADVTGDGSINIIDALLIAQYYVELITSFPGC